MTQTLGILQRRMKTVKELQDIVDTMKTMASLNINTYEKVDVSLAVYFRVIETAFCAMPSMATRGASSASAQRIS